MTNRELAYIVLDELKGISDDTYYTPEHIIFMANRYRALLLYQKYVAQKIWQELEDSNEQEICVTLQIDTEQQDSCGDTLLKSTQKIPETMGIGELKINLPSQFSGEIAWVSKRRFKYVGYNKWLKNIIYATKGDDDYLYLKSNNPQAYYLDTVRLSGIFQDPEEAAKYSCEENNTSGEVTDNCDYLDKEFPLEDALTSTLINQLVKEFSTAAATPMDDFNNAKDDLSDIATFIRRNMKSAYQKKQEYGDPTEKA